MVRGKIGREHALVLALKGDLGAGKTTFTQGFAKGLGIARRLISPTFVIMRHYSLTKSKKAQFTDLYHIDAYRMKDLDALKMLGVDDLLANPQNIILMEWPEKMRKLLPKSTIWLEFDHGKKENERVITLL